MLWLYTVVVQHASESTALSSRGEVLDQRKSSSERRWGGENLDNQEVSRAVQDYPQDSFGASQVQQMIDGIIDKVGPG